MPDFFFFGAFSFSDDCGKMLDIPSQTKWPDAFSQDKLWHKDRCVHMPDEQ